jgi:hypothetical protein
VDRGQWTIIAYAEMPQAFDPTEGSFDHPADTVQMTAMRGSSAAKVRSNTEPTENLPMRLWVESCIAIEIIRMRTGTSTLAMYDRKRSHSR